MKILAIRHALTTFNKQGLLQGRSDQDIDDSLIDTQELKFNQKIIAGLKPEKIICSSLKRTQQTARHYGYEKADLIIDDRIIEYDFGEFEGKKKQLMLDQHKNNWVNNFSHITFGEGFLSVSQRLDSFIDFHKQNNSCILIFAHGLVLRYLTSQITWPRLQQN